MGSIREQLYGTRPPRGLFCDFPLGRPLGVPADPEFQTRVLAAGFALLTSTGPIIEDYPETVKADASEVLVCPLPARFDADAHPAVQELLGLRSAYDRAVAKYGNRVGAVRTIAADELAAGLESFIRIAQGMPWKEAGIPGVPARVAQDIRGYYEMAALDIVGHTPAAWAGYRWYRDQTESGRVIKAAQKAMAEAGVKPGLWRFLLPLDAAV